MFFVVHNCVQCAIRVLFVQNIKNLEMQKINVSYVYYHIQMSHTVSEETDLRLRGTHIECEETHPRGPHIVSE